MPTDKATILKAIRQAGKAKLEEQRTYRQVIKAARSEKIAREQVQELEELHWEEISQRMANEDWPPCSNDWQGLTGLNWDKTPKQMQLSAIPDDEIRFAVYHFSELSEQTERIKAAAKFYKAFGAQVEQIDSIFALWVKITRSAAMKAN